MDIELTTPNVPELGVVVRALSEWQADTAPLQLHPGDLGWFCRNGPVAAAAAVRTWIEAGHILAVGLLDGSDILRLTSAPAAQRNEKLARRVVADVTDPARGVLPTGEVAVETPTGALIGDLLGEAGWKTGEPWTPLRRDLTRPVEATDLRIEVVGPGQVSDFAEVVRSSFGSGRFTDERWRAMAEGPAYADAESLLGYDARGVAVAAVTVWAAGPGRPGLLEPMGVHAGHRGRGYGTAITVAAAAALQQLGSCSALVCTPSANVGGVATYRKAGFVPQPERRDRCRPARPQPRSALLGPPGP